ncbi:MAG TPA: hypothetical protein VIP11_17910 [Gemmatimonadaceae bacterium]
MLFHISEDADIEEFIPRSAGATLDALVWAIDARHLRNYLLPRDCPRVTYSAVPTTTGADREQFLAGHNAVVAIETAWLERVRNARVFCYQLSPETFELLDAAAGYFVSRKSVRPQRVDVIDDTPARLQALDVELRVLSNLWDLHDSVAASSLEFSMIRMRHAEPRVDR